MLEMNLFLKKIIWLALNQAKTSVIFWQNFCKMIHISFCKQSKRKCFHENCCKWNCLTFTMRAEQEFVEKMMKFHPALSNSANLLEFFGGKSQIVNWGWRAPYDHTHILRVWIRVQLISLVLLSQICFLYSYSVL